MDHYPFSLSLGIIYKNLICNDGDDKKANASIPYRRIIESPLYVATHTQPVIAVTISKLALHAESPKEIHVLTMKMVFGYLKEKRKVVISLRPGSFYQLTVIIDFNWTGKKGLKKSEDPNMLSNTETRQSTISLSCRIFFLRSKYEEISDAMMDVIWLCNLLNDLGLNQSTTVNFE